MSLRQKQLNAYVRRTEDLIEPKKRVSSYSSPIHDPIAEINRRI